MLDAFNHIIHAVMTAKKSVAVVAATDMNMPSSAHELFACVVISYIFHKLSIHYLYADCKSVLVAENKTEVLYFCCNNYMGPMEAERPRALILATACSFKSALSAASPRLL